MQPNDLIELFAVMQQRLAVSTRLSAEDALTRAKEWFADLSEFDRETVFDAARRLTGDGRKHWPSVGEVAIEAREIRKGLREKVGFAPPPPRFTPPRECPLAVEARRRDAELRARQNQLMREAGCAPIDWSKPHAAEFARIEPFREAARKELGYVD